MHKDRGNNSYWTGCTKSRRKHRTSSVLDSRLYWCKCWGCRESTDKVTLTQKAADQDPRVFCNTSSLFLTILCKTQKLCEVCVCKGKPWRSFWSCWKEKRTSVEKERKAKSALAKKAALMKRGVSGKRRLNRARVKMFVSLTLTGGDFTRKQSRLSKGGGKERNRWGVAQQKRRRRRKRWRGGGLTSSTSTLLFSPPFFFFPHPSLCFSLWVVIKLSRHRWRSKTAQQTDAWESDRVPFRLYEELWATCDKPWACTWKKEVAERQKPKKWLAGSFCI